MNIGGRSHPQSTGRVRIGPGLLVTAAFIGPGTVVTASRAGAEHGCQLLWTVAFACLGTIVLQSLAARLGILQGAGLGESIRNSLQGSKWLRPAIALILAALGIGNAAYQTGNLTGAVAGVESVFGGSSLLWLGCLILATSAIVWTGRYKVLHRVLIGLVLLLSTCFLITGLLSLPAAWRMASGLTTPNLNEGNLNLVIAMIGTTIVPYNLFLHCSGAASTWKKHEPRQAMRASDWDTVLSISLGGMVTASILLTGNATFFDRGLPWTSLDQIAQQLDPTLGQLSGVVFGVGLFAAGLTSAITAPLATAYAICGCFGWRAEPSDQKFRLIALSVIWIGGGLAALFGKSPALTIQFAQLANGLLLPVAAIFLMYALKQRDRDGEAGIGRLRWTLAVLIVTAVVLLGFWRMFGVFH